MLVPTSNELFHGGNIFCLSSSERVTQQNALTLRIFSQLSVSDYSNLIVTTFDSIKNQRYTAYKIDSVF